MPQFEIVVTGESREIYVVQAETDQDARKQFDEGKVTNPVVSEITNAEVLTVTEL